jgi:hypothetical protein
VSRDIGQALARALSVNFMKFDGAAKVETMSSIGWASVTFTGARHRLRIELEGPGAAEAAADLLAEMDELEVPLPGHIVADLALLADGRSDDGKRAWLEIEALTIEDR